MLLMFCYELCHRSGLANICIPKKRGKMRVEFPRILYWKDVKIRDNQVQSAFISSLVSV